jgi:hypothetical protein
MAAIDDVKSQVGAALERLKELADVKAALVAEQLAHAATKAQLDTANATLAQHEVDLTAIRDQLVAG